MDPDYILSEESQTTYFVVDLSDCQDGAIGDGYDGFMVIRDAVPGPESTKIWSERVCLSEIGNLVYGGLTCLVEDVVDSVAADYLPDQDSE